MMQDKSPSAAAGFVDAGTLPAFRPDVPKIQRQDLLNSTLLGQLDADKLCSRTVDPDEWHKKYFGTLGKVGWRFDTISFNHFRLHSPMFTIEEIVMRLLQPVTSEGERTLVQETMRSLRDLPDADPRVIVFNGYSHSKFSVNAQFSVRTPEAMVSTGIVFTTSQELKSLLNEKLETERLKDGILSIVQVATLNEVVYSQVRESVIRKLGPKREELIWGLDIGIDRLK